MQTNKIIAALAIALAASTACASDASVGCLKSLAKAARDGAALASKAAPARAELFKTGPAAVAAKAADDQRFKEPLFPFPKRGAPSSALRADAAGALLQASVEARRQWVVDFGSFVDDARPRCMSDDPDSQEILGMLDLWFNGLFASLTRAAEAGLKADKADLARPPQISMARPKASIESRIRRDSAANARIVRKYAAFLDQVAALPPGPKTLPAAER